MRNALKMKNEKSRKRKEKREKEEKVRLVLTGMIFHNND